MKQAALIYIFLIPALFTSAEITYDFQNKPETFDGTNTVDIALIDGSRAFTMTVAGVGGYLNSNDGYFGIGDGRIDGTAESIRISFDTPIDFTSIDLRLISGDLSDGASITLGPLPTVQLYTGSPTPEEFNGSLDTYTPADTVRIESGSIVLTGSSDTSNFSLQQITFTAVPEPSTSTTFILGGLIVFTARRTAGKSSRQST